jgi:hypothetical protein
MNFRCALMPLCRYNFTPRGAAWVEPIKRLMAGILIDVGRETPLALTIVRA